MHGRWPILIFIFTAPQLNMHGFYSAAAVAYSSLLYPTVEQGVILALRLPCRGTPSPSPLYCPQWSMVFVALPIRLKKLNIRVILAFYYSCTIQWNMFTPVSQMVTLFPHS